MTEPNNTTPEEQPGSQPQAQADAQAEQEQSHETDPRPQSFKDLKPWEGEARTGDKVLLWFLFGVPAFYMVLLPFRPFLIAKIPTVLALITGARTVIAGAGAFAAVEGRSLTLVILAGLVGMLKFDWLFWLAGKMWGEGVLRLYATTPAQKRQFEKIKRMPRWLLYIMLFLSRFPGVPGPIIALIAGWSRVRFLPYFLVTAAGALVISIALATLGYVIGQPAVDVLKVVDKYAIFISLALIFGLVAWSSIRSNKKRQAS
ncbi:membrane protein DedA with SNARE-associated domain [Brevibacterium paucivorans]|uniref:Membrane protein DedA with SNARE-associated domain n=1 Tax=Brevibacterium paucivorans TaxID=170994 RepID=A0ABS2SK20_9MICO|nr:DedA family protein [Brevibacterium paucivorans]MBM7816598.1 membrane protein DedA with SNARE-associated domain [Brevibacterium paucivorans]